MKKNCLFFNAPVVVIHKHCFFSLLILFSLFSSVSRAQVNAYAKVTSIAGTRLNLSNVSQTYHTFQNGEQIIIMQMQDNVIGTNTSNDANFGTMSAIANAGIWEVATISSRTGLPAYLTITANLQNNYTVGANRSVQIISFRKMSASNYTTLANMIALPWNGNIGGVIAIQVPGILTLAHTITADGQGFRGGAVSSNFVGSCTGNIYTSNSANYAAKGEGIYLSANAGYNRGRARLLNGGGGGTPDNAGGGGGGHYTAGGQGGAGWNCAAAPGGGLGGITLRNHITAARIFMGGGGGGGQQNNTMGKAGANGGGIVIIKAGTLVTSCSGTMRISANGAMAPDSGGDGAGGAGAGGSVILDINQFTIPASCPLVLQSNGGNGGDVVDANMHGGGGGGGQGVIMFLNKLPAANVTATTNNGTGGQNYTGGPTAESGAGVNNSGVLLGNGTVLPVSLPSFTVRERDRDGINGQPGNLSVFPNPARESFRVQVNGMNSKIWLVTLVDITGRTVYQHKHSSTNNEIRIFMDQKIRPGIYTIRISTREGTQLGKLVIQ